MIRDLIGGEYLDVFGRQMHRGAIMDCEYYLSEGVEADVIICAIQVTAEAPTPSWRYTQAILARCYRNGICSLEAWDDDQRRHREQCAKLARDKEHRLRTAYTDW